MISILRRLTFDALRVCTYSFHFPFEGASRELFVLHPPTNKVLLSSLLYAPCPINFAFWTAFDTSTGCLHSGTAANRNLGCRG
jgi:hypothetical protein